MQCGEGGLPSPESACWGDGPATWRDRLDRAPTFSKTAASVTIRSESESGGQPPLRVRVGRAASRPSFPRVSILARPCSPAAAAALLASAASLVGRSNSLPLRARSESSPARAEDAGHGSLQVTLWLSSGSESLPVGTAGIGTPQITQLGSAGNDSDRAHPGNYSDHLGGIILTSLTSLASTAATAVAAVQRRPQCGGDGDAGPSCWQSKSAPQCGGALGSWPSPWHSDPGPPRPAPAPPASPDPPPRPPQGPPAGARARRGWA